MNMIIYYLKKQINRGNVAKRLIVQPTYYVNLSHILVVEVSCLI